MNGTLTLKQNGEWGERKHVHQCSHVWQFIYMLISLLHASKFLCVHTTHGTLHLFLVITLADDKALLI